MIDGSIEGQSAAPVVGPTVGPGRPAPSVELTLATQANDAMQAGADPKAATDMLGTMIRHLRANPDVAAQAADALAKGADPHAVSSRIYQLSQLSQAAPASQAPPLPPASPPNAISRALSNAATFAREAITHPINTAAELAAAPLKSLNTAMSPGSASDVADLNRFGAAGKAGPVGVLPYRSSDIVTPGQRAAAVAQTVANVALPGLTEVGTSLAARTVGRIVGSGASKMLGLAAGGAGAGAAYDPSDPLAGALTGAMLAPVLHATGTAGTSATSRLLTRAADVFGRPAETTPILSVGGAPLAGRVLSTADRAAQLNADALRSSNAPRSAPQPAAQSAPAVSASGVPLSEAPLAGTTPTLDLNSDRPLAPVDANVSAQRIARGLKTSSPAAEQVLRTALNDRDAGAIDRMIQHGLEATGLATRENGVQVVDDMIAQRAQHGNENYQPVFQQYRAPLDDPDFAAVAKTPAGQLAMKRAGILAANRSEAIGAASPGTTGATFDPSTLPTDKQAMYAKLLQTNGGQVEPTLAAMRVLGESIPVAPTDGASVTPTLKQAHYVKLAFDDMLNSAPEPGSGGMGPNNASAIRGLKGRWVAAMDRAAPEYADARQTFADESDLIRGAELGRQLWKLHPAEAEKAFNELPSDARDVARRTGFDALADRIENGPADVERGVSKPRDQRRMRLLFPDDASFAQFRQGLTEEAKMHATREGVLGGSNTADKFADLAGMAGVTLPDVLSAATGRVRPLVMKATRALITKAGAANADNLAVERAKQLVAGANGDKAARAAAIASVFGTPP